MRTQTESAAHGKLPVASAKESWHEASQLLRTRRGVLTATILLLLAGSSCALLIPLALGWIVDAVIDGSGISAIVAIGAAIVVAGLFSAVILRWGGRLLVVCLQGALAQLREEVFCAAIRLDQQTIETAGSSDVVSRVTTDVDAVTEAVSDVLPRFVQAGFTILLTAAGLALLDPWLALAALAAAPIQAITTVRFLRRSRPLYRRLRREESERGQAIIESLHGADTIVAHGAHNDRLDQIATRSLTAIETERSTGIVRNRFNAGLNAAEFVGLASILAVGFWQSITAELTVGAITAAALFFHQLFAPIGSLLASLDDLQRANAGLARLVGVLRARPRERSADEIEDASVRVRNVTHRYSAGAPSALTGVELALPAGSTTVLVGVSGSGKSTLAQLIAGVCDPSEGEVLVGGVSPLSAAHRGRRAVLLVTQETHRFGGTLAENLRLGAPRADDAELWSALDAVEADWVRALPEGIDTRLGHDLDDARVQQLALARVLLANPPVVVLDEATSHAGSSGILDRAVQTVTRGRTAIIVAHRLSVAAGADHIVVLDDGRVREVGTHAELLRHSNGAYARLHRAAQS